MMKVLLSTLLVMVMGLGGCIIANPPEGATSVETYSTPPRAHSTLHPEGNETSFILTPNTSCSIVLYLQENQWLKVNCSFSPPEEGQRLITVKYTYPEGYDVAASRSFETLSGHDEGYYSIDFYYRFHPSIGSWPVGAKLPEPTVDGTGREYDPDIHKNVDIIVHWEIEGEEPLSSGVAITLPPGVPAGPEVPAEVVAMWKSPPPRPGSPADIQDKITLEPNTATESTEGSEGMSISVIPAGTFQDSTSFYLKEGQWVDVVVSSLDIPVYFNWTEPGAVSIKPNCWIEYEGDKWASGFRSPVKVGDKPVSRDMGVFGPFDGKPFYENLVTSTEKGTIYTTAFRIFAWEGASEYWFAFYNWNSERKADITCRVYKLGVTPGWGDEYWDAEMQPWLNELYSLLYFGEISQEENDLAENHWLAQFD